jgi:hypothetical protein
MSWWQRLWRKPSSTSLPERLRGVTLMLDGWTEEAATGQLRVWRDSQGDVLSLATADGSLGLPSLSDVKSLHQWCREVAAGREAGLIEVHVGDGPLGATAGLIYKRLGMPAYIFTGMLFVLGDEVADVWTIVSAERGTTGIREAIVTAQMMNDGTLTIEDYETSWAQDPYAPTYRGVDRSVLRFASDDERYDGQFPDHPLSKVRRMLAALPGAVQVESGGESRHDVEAP